jgi:RimJ/RimL family protein N-acetyltransferase
MRKYKCLSKTEWFSNEYKLVSIRTEDKYEILNWRNSQIEILRQKDKKSKDQQDYYFANVVDKLFEEEFPNQLLFSFLYNDVLIGYGGLVHIDWESKNAEISFLLNNNNDFQLKFSEFMRIIFVISFEELKLVKIHTTVYNIEARKRYIEVVEKLNFVKEAILKNHILIENKYYDVLIYSYFNKRHENWITD